MKVYRINEYDYYAANDAEEAISVALKETGATYEELVDDLYFEETDLDLTFTDCDNGGKMTLRDCLSTMTKPGFVVGLE